MFFAFLTAVCFALSAIFAIRSTRLVGVAAANSARLGIAAVFLAAWAHGFGGGLGGAGLWTFVLSGMAGFGLGDLAMFGAYPLLGARLTSLMVQCLASPLAALIEWLWLGTRLTGLELACGAVILLGVAIAVAPETPVDPAALVDTAAHRRGLLLGVLAALGQAGGAVISRKAHAISQAAGFPVDGGTAAYQRLLGGLAVVAVAYFFTRRRAVPNPAPAGHWQRAWPWALANSLAGAVFGVSCFQRALATTPSALVMPVVALTPLIVVPFAFVLDGERPGLRSLLGGTLAVLAAAVLASQR